MLLDLLKTHQTRASQSLYNFEPYPKQVLAASMLAKHDYVCLSALNQGGKTEESAQILAQHATGEYQQWFIDSGAPLIPECKLIWAVSITPATLQAGLTFKLLGRSTYDKAVKSYNSGNWDGVLPRDLIIDIKREVGTDRVGTVFVKNINGQEVRISFHHCAKDVTSFQAETKVDYIAVDEGIPLKYWNELMPRQTHGCKGFYGLITMTPHMDAPVDFIDHVFERAEQGTWAGNGTIKITIDDVPDRVISRKQKDKLIQKTQERQKPARLYGEPIGSGGLVFGIRSHEITMPRSHFLRLLSEKSFIKLYGQDFGFNDAMGFISLHIDPISGIVIMDREVKQHEMTPSEFVSHLKLSKFDFKYPVAWPHDGNRRDKREDKKPYVQSFKDAGLNMMSEHVKKPVKETNKVAHWWDIEDKAKQKLFYIVEDCTEICSEWDLLRIDEATNKVVGEDHLMDALVCAWQKRHLGKRVDAPKAKTLNLNKPDQRVLDSGIDLHLTW